MAVFGRGGKRILLVGLIGVTLAVLFFPRLVVITTATSNGEQVEAAGAPTANANWREIKDSLYPGENSIDRPDVVSRIFEAKVKELIRDLMKRNVLGKVKAILLMTEWQKRGLPHVHILLIMHPDDVPKSPEEIDKVITPTTLIQLHSR